MRTKLGILVFAPILAGCGFALGAGVDVYHEDVYYEDGHYGPTTHGGAVYVEAAPARFDRRWLPVPRGHLPPPGRCRAWLPGVPPGRQMPPGSCRSVERRVPPGGWLLVRPRNAPGLVELIAYDARRIGVRTRYAFDVRTGRRVNLY